MEQAQAVRYPWNQDDYYSEYHNRMRMIAHFLEQKQAKSVLDLGCGQGRMREILPEGVAYYGCDGHWEKPPYDDAPYSNWVFHSDSPALPFDSQAFDAISCSGLIEYIADQPALFRAIFARLAPGGAFLCSAINPLYPRFIMGRYKLPKGKWHPAWHHVRPYRAILEDMRSAGFTLDSYAWVPDHETSAMAAKQGFDAAKRFAPSAPIPAFWNFAETQILFVAIKPASL